MKSTTWSLLLLAVTLTAIGLLLPIDAAGQIAPFFSDTDFLLPPSPKPDPLLGSELLVVKGYYRLPPGIDLPVPKLVPDATSFTYAILVASPDLKIRLMGDVPQGNKFVRVLLNPVDGNGSCRWYSDFPPPDEIEVIVSQMPGTTRTPSSGVIILVWQGPPPLKF